MEINELEKKIVRDLAVELSDEFDRNFERKAFFDQKWPTAKLNNSRGSLLNRTGNLRRSIRYKVSENMITFSSSLPYASIHNKGGEIEVTEKMKKYFWAMFFRADGAIMMKRNSSGEAVNRDTKKNRALSVEAQKWKALALMKVGHKIKVEKRQIIGDHPQVAKIIKSVIDDNMILFNESIANQFRR